MDQAPLTTAPPTKGCIAHSVLQRIWFLRVQQQQQPAAAPLPRTSPARLDLATPSNSKPSAISAPLAASSPLAAPYLAAANTVLYLAYGSNLAARTFRGQRGIRPLSATVVAVPALRLAFDLPGIAYAEPCFANTAVVRDKPDGRGLVGVVYELTPADYATVVRTEGGGASYTDILVPCFAIQPSAAEAPPRPPFLAHTLYAPPAAAPADDDAAEDYGGGGDGLRDRLRRWLARPVRPNPGYAQPSARYLALLVDGAAEHGLPAEYQRYLGGLRAYTVTTWRQAVGRWVFLAVAAPVLVAVLALGRVLADGGGNLPAWLALVVAAVNRAVWALYDGVFKPVFGDGERTVEGGGGGGGGGGAAARGGFDGQDAAGDEKLG